jgi:hypothetical protein
MAGILDFPTVVQEALRHFGDLLPNEPQRRHFAESLTGLCVAERKNVSGINREFAQTTDQSGLNRFLTEADWDVRQLNQRRLRIPDVQHKVRSVILWQQHDATPRIILVTNRVYWEVSRIVRTYRRRAILWEALRQTLSWAMERNGSNPYWTKERVIAYLGLS